MFLALRGPLRPPECPQWLPVGSLEWGEKSREYMLLWADFIIAFWAATLIGDKVLQSEEIFRSSVHSSPPFLGHPARPEAQPANPEAPPARPKASGLAGWASRLAGWPRRGDKRTDGWTDGRKISPFYRTLSPIGAAALLPPYEN